MIIDRIPFPRPDDPLVAARQRPPTRAAATASCRSRPPTPPCCWRRARAGCCAAWTTAGVVAVLDPRLATARYGGFLRASLPPFWPTDDPEKVLGALRRLRDAAA